MDKTNSSTLIETFERLFAAGKEEHFESGMESHFSINLLALIEKYGYIALEVVGNLISNESVNPVVAEQALRWIGHSEQAGLPDHRRLLLEQNLTANSHYVRDGALMGISYMDDPKAIPALKAAIEHEPIDELRQDMVAVLQQLEETLTV